MRASRLLSLLMTLQAKGRVSATRLSEELGVSVRTIYRDVDELSATGVPVVAQRGVEGGFELLDGWRTRLTGMTSDEARAMLMVGLPGPARELGLGEAMAGAQLKLLAALPPDWQASAEQMGARFHLDPIGWYRSRRQPDHLATVAQGVWTDRRLEIRYRSWKKTSWRTVEPLGLVLKGGDWYLVAVTPERPGKSEPVSFRLSNVLDARLLAESIRRPARFELAAYWTRYVERFEASLRQRQATLRFTPVGWKRAIGFRTALSRMMVEGGPKKTRTGRQVTITYERDELIAPELLRLGNQVEVLSPPELRALLQRTGEEIVRLYARRGPGSG